MSVGQSPRKPRVLFVDDESHILETYKINLGREWDVFTAESGKQALAIIKNQGPFSVIVSDLRMPQMDGVEFLREADVISQRASCILLTGNADLESTIASVNDLNLFRFLQKPTPIEELSQVLEEALKSHNAIMSEQSVLETTLQESVKVLVEMLSMMSPVVFGLSKMMHRYTVRLCEKIGLSDRWSLEAASLLYNLGALFYDRELIERYYNGEGVTEEELEALKKLPAKSAEMLKRIPRMEVSVRLIVSETSERNTPLEQLYDKIFSIVRDFSLLKTQGYDSKVALGIMKSDMKKYHEKIFQVFEKIQVGSDRVGKMVNIPLSELKEGMEICSHVYNSSGVLMISKGQVVTELLKDTLSRYEAGDLLKTRVDVYRSGR